MESHPPEIPGVSCTFLRRGATLEGGTVVQETQSEDPSDTKPGC